MTTTFEQARKLAYDANLPVWQARGYRGEYFVADYGYEDANAWLMVDGAREWVEGGDDRFVVFDQPSTVVLKDSGAVVDVSYVDNADWLDAMTPVGDVPPDA